MHLPFVSETLWSSSLQQKDLPRVRDFLAGNGFSETEIALVTPETGHQSSRQKWATFYDDKGSCYSIQYPVPIPEGSVFLKLKSRYSGREERDAAHTNVIAVANSLRMTFGVPIARELVLVRHYTSDPKDAAEFSDVGFASKFDSQSLNFFEDPPIENAKLRSIPLDVSILLHKAFAQSYPHERFVLMWLAFEAVVHSLPGSGDNGKKRQRYFADILGSEVASGEVNRVRKIRNDAFKEGRFNEANLEEASWSLYAALQLVLLEECPHRVAFLEGYEAYVNSRHST